MLLKTKFRLSSKCNVTMEHGSKKKTTTFNTYVWRIENIGMSDMATLSLVKYFSFKVLYVNRLKIDKIYDKNTDLNVATLRALQVIYGQHK